MYKALLGVCLVAALFTAATQAQREGAQARVFVEYMPANTITVHPGQKVPATFTFRVKEGYHINSNKPLLEELIPTQVQFTVVNELTVSKLQYPAGELTSFPFDPTQKLSVYSGDVVVHAEVSVPASAKPGSVTVQGELKYQACDNNACYPPKKLPISFNVRIEEGARK
jgi:DsbC/DsbD-like thiol-disulfide interchange protein